jgi:haloalkane dehalogenase
LDWANHHRDAIKGIACMAAIVRFVTWDDWPDDARTAFQGFRSPVGEHMILDNKAFIEQVLPGLVLRDLSDGEMGHYRRPYLPGRGPPAPLT